jgi:hypothetical protein
MTAACLDQIVAILSSGRVFDKDYSGGSAARMLSEHFTLNPCPAGLLPIE